MSSSSAPSEAGETQRRSVERTLAAIIREAELQADLVARFLRSRGLKPTRTSKPEGNPKLPQGLAADFLMELGAALRLRMWERAGLTEILPPGLPNAAESLASAAGRAAAGQGRGAADRDAPTEVLRACINYFSAAGRTELAADVVVPSAEDRDELLDVLADMLWEYRHLADEKS